LGKQKIAVLVNPKAGLNTRREGLGRVIGGVLRSIADAKVFETKDLDALQLAGKRITEAGTDIVVIPGGDGSIQKNITAVITEHDRMRPRDPYPQIVILPCGTMNNVATYLGSTWSNPKRLAERIATKLARGQPLDVKHLAALRVNDQYCFIYGAGVVVNILEWYYEGRPNLGPTRALKVVAAAFWQELLSMTRIRRRKSRLMAPVHAKVTLPIGNEPPVSPFMSHTALLAGTITSVGMGCQAIPSADDLGCFGLRSSQISFWRALMSVPQLWAALGIPRTHDFIVPEAEIAYLQPTKRTLDGELEAPTDCDKLSIGPTLSFIVG
jgi:hypothetical protein